MKTLNSLKLSQRLIVLIATFSIGFLIYGGWTYKLFLDLNTGSLYQRIVLGKDFVADILPPPQNVMETYLVGLQLLNEADSLKRKALMDKLNQLKREYYSRHEFWLKQVDLGIESTALEAANKGALEVFELIQKQIIPALEIGDVQTATAWRPRLDQAYLDHERNINALVILSTQMNADNQAALESYTTSSVLWLLAVFLLTLSIGLVMAIAVTRGVIQQLGGDPAYMASLVKRFAKGDFSEDMPLKTNDRHSLLYDLKILQKMINTFSLSQQEIVNHHAAGMISEMMWVDEFPGIFKTLAEQINQLIKAHIDVNEQVVSIIGEYAQGDFSRDLVRLPGEHERISEAVDSIKCALLGISKEIELLASAAAYGDFTRRGDDAPYHFIFKTILVDLNKLVETCDNGFGDIERVAGALANGDLTQTITKNYPGTFGTVSQSVNATVEYLKTLVNKIKQASETISSASNEIAVGNNTLAHRTEEQAASIQQTSSSMTELISTVQQNTLSAQQSNDLSEGSADIAAKGVLVVSEVVETMNSIHDSSLKIVEIISVIDSIAFQTNILALNAAVEAARAGTEGRGFAVVAGEVRNLAQRAAVAAGQIKTLINDSEEKIEAGNKLANHAGDTMKEIVNSIQQVTRNMASISAASLQQSSGITQINQAVIQLDVTTQQNATLVEQAAAAAESLQDQVQQLVSTVAVFKVGFEDAASAFALQKSVSSPNNRPLSGDSQVLDKGILNRLDQAIQKHAEWKTKFRTAINHHEKLDVETIAKDDCCDFGKFLYSEIDSGLGQLSSFPSCLATHTQFHREAAKVAQAINDEHYQEAQNMMGGDSSFVNASIDVGVAIMRLKQDISPVADLQSMLVLQTEALPESDEWEVF
ncbi:MAG: CZB domain-containing protein [Methylovulum sp.]|nr:CZB domain-containing protein [Methylovulum sp.]MCF7998353.1 CZB domain-containing protein [Methylovulum sp.]